MAAETGNYITQNDDWNANRQNCGAFSIAYYLGETGRETVTEGLVNGIYEKIQFGAAGEDLGLRSDYCNPVLMIEALVEQGISAEKIYFYTGAEGNPIYKIYQGMMANGLLPDGVQERVVAGESLNTGILQGDGYGILICGIGNGLHYVLVHKEGGNLQMMNPWHGEWQEADDGFWEGSAVIEDLCSLQAGIWIAN